MLGCQDVPCPFEMNCEEAHVWGPLQAIPGPGEGVAQEEGQSCMSLGKGSMMGADAAL